MHQNYIKYNTKTASKSTPSFTGKERDSETGFSYFGARFYDSDLMTGWLSVDPMADKYPSLSPYAYCAWNPVRLVDPDGNRVWPISKIYNNSERKIISGMYRNNSGKFHGGVDIVHRPKVGPPNTSGGSIVATHNGKVVISGTSKTAGNWIVIENGNIRTKYMHMEDISNYKVGEYVLEGTEVGKVGSTGRSEGPHLHYQIEQYNTETNEWEKINPVEGNILKVNEKMDVNLIDPQKMIDNSNNVAQTINLNEVKIIESKIVD
ncbi:MAG: peptidoglycan DD-metalloendopeptidase family protein [Bacteroidales bacterium]|nr:peptidoglycan DD-metalloendopeptidase family protein [Bacteroidales bacterium]